MDAIPQNSSDASFASKGEGKRTVCGRGYGNAKYQIYRTARLGCVIIVARCTTIGCINAV